MIGYAEMKRRSQARAHRDRQAAERVTQPDRDRADLIARLATAFPLLNISAIAEAVNPWNPQTFKESVVFAQARYLAER
jgi:hypothetical protein